MIANTINNPTIGSDVNKPKTTNIPNMTSKLVTLPLANAQIMIIRHNKPISSPTLLTVCQNS